MIRIGHIGYGGHGLRIQTAIQSYNQTTSIINYDHESSEGCVRFSEKFLKSQCIFISSPSSTHLSYLEALKTRSYYGYIYCEKPGLGNVDELSRLNQCIDWFSGRLLIGYHRPYTKHHRIIRDLIMDREFGHIRSMTIQEGFGLSYSAIFNKSWRSKDVLSIASVGLSHILSSFLSFFPQLSPADFSYKVTRNRENGYWDTAYITSNAYVPFVLHGMYSWGSPAHDHMRIVSTNCIANIEEGNRLLIYRPRDTFDDEGQYAYPEGEFLQLPESTILESVHNFLDHVHHMLLISPEQPRNAALISKHCLEAIVL